MKRFVASAITIVVAVALLVIRLAPGRPSAPASSGVSAAPNAQAGTPVVPAPTRAPARAPATTANATIERAYATHASGVRVDGRGVVSRVLPDDNQGDRHQRFVVRLPSGQSVLITHNIDLAPRIQNLRVGDTVAFAGEFVWNEKGGLVHWTHHDPSGRHAAGWLERAGRRYQ